MEWKLVGGDDLRGNYVFTKEEEKCSACPEDIHIDGFAGCLTEKKKQHPRTIQLKQDHQLWYILQ